MEEIKTVSWYKCDVSALFLIAEARMRNKAMKREALQAAREAKKERGR